MNAFNTTSPVTHSRNMKWISEHCESRFLTAVKSVEAFRLVQLALTTDALRSKTRRSARSCWKLKFWKTRSQRSKPWRRPSQRTSRPPACPPSPLWNSALCSDLSQLFVSPEWTTGGKINLWDHQNKLWSSAEYLHLKLASAPLLFLSSFYVLLSQFEFSS